MNIFFHSMHSGTLDGFLATPVSNNMAYAFDGILSTYITSGLVADLSCFFFGNHLELNMRETCKGQNGKRHHIGIPVQVRFK